MIEEDVVARPCFRPRFQHLASLVPVDVSEARVDSSSGVASVVQVLVEYAAFLEPDRGAAGVREQSLHLGLEPASKNVSRVVGSVGQIGVSVTGFAVDLERESCQQMKIYGFREAIEMFAVWFGSQIIMESETFD